MKATVLFDTSVLLAALVLYGLFGGRALAQEATPAGPEIPARIAEWAVDFQNDPGTARFGGSTDIPAGRVLVGDVAVLGGDLTVGGTVRGNVLVVNGDLHFLEGGRIEGEVTVLGGESHGSSLNSIGGGLVVYDARLPYLVEDGRVSLMDSQDRRATAETPDSDHPDEGRAAFEVGGPLTYNRIEGLPVSFGPNIRTVGPHPLRLEAFGIWRTETRLEDEFGYRLEAEQFFGQNQNFSIGGRAFSQVNAIESWGITDDENSLAAVILHKDFRDYFERRGWSSFITARVPRTALRLHVEYLDEEHAYAPVGDPWSLSDNGEPWRPQPLVGQGRLRSVEGSLTVDTRDSRRESSGGWWVQAHMRRGLSGALEVPTYLVPASTAMPGGATHTGNVIAGADLRMGILDLRRYARVGRGSELRVRGALGGSLDRTPLPPQFQHALGGEGSIPGQPFFSGDCGARTHPVGLPSAVGATGTTVPAFASYGCDRIALFQVEYRGHFGFGWESGREDRGAGDADEGPRDSNWSLRGGINPSWIAFFDAGRGWVYGNQSAAGRPDAETLMDLGFGLLLGRDLGVYVAFPLREEDPARSGPHIFIRLSRRF